MKTPPPPPPPPPAEKQRPKAKGKGPTGHSSPLPESFDRKSKVADATLGVRPGSVKSGMNNSHPSPPNYGHPAYPPQQESPEKQALLQVLEDQRQHKIKMGFIIIIAAVIIAIVSMIESYTVFAAFGCMISIILGIIGLTVLLIGLMKPTRPPMYHYYPPPPPPGYYPFPPPPPPGYAPPPTAEYPKANSQNQEPTSSSSPLKTHPSPPFSDHPSYPYPPPPPPGYPPPPPGYHPYPYYPYPTRGDVEIQSGLMPDRYDAMFYIGLTIFIFGIFLGAVDISLFTIPIIGNLISTYAIYLDFKNKPKTGLGTAGNVIAIMWIILAWFIIVMLISMLSSM